MTNFLLLHGGGGPATVASLSAHLSTLGTVLAPTLPGWNGTPRGELATVRDYGNFYADLLETDDLTDVLVVGSSVGGWIAVELALVSTRVGKLVLIDAGGIDVPGEPITNISGFAPQDIAKVSFHDPSKFTPPPAAALPIMQANQATLAAIAGDPYMYDPTLLGRLGGIHVPTLVIWGESDGVFTAGYGRAYAAAIPRARFVEVSEAGHLPQLENPEAVFAAVDGFVSPVVD